MGGVTKELAGGCGPRAETDEVLDISPLQLVWAGAGADTNGLSLLSFSLRAPGGHMTVRGTAWNCKFVLSSATSYLLSKALSEFVSGRWVALGFLGQLSSGYLSTGV